jgi:hypothetical protein
MANQPDPLRHFVYPFPLREGRSLVEPDDLDDYLRRWSQTNDGFFMLGNNGQWHGGIHFDENTGRGLAQEEGVRCIADGEVIAYRIDDDVKYPVVEFDKGRAPYSTGFVLVRHRLQLPSAPRTSVATPVPQPAAQTETAVNTVSQPEEPSLVFYSLYMHLRHWRAYKEDRYLVRPAFWEKPEHQRIVGDKAKDPRPAWSIANPGEEKKGLNVRKDGLGRGAAKIGWLPRGARITLGDGDDKWRKIASVNEGKIAFNSAETPLEEALLGWVFVKELNDPPPEPELCREVYVLPTPKAIRAKEIVGHLGEYLRLDDVKLRSVLRPLTHLEAFTGEDISAFIQRSRNRDKELPASHKTLSKVEAGARLIQPGSPDTALKAGESFKAWGDNTGNAPWVQVKYGAIEEVQLSARMKPYDSKTKTYKDGSLFIAKLANGKRKIWRPQGVVWIERGHLSQEAVTTAGQDIPAWSRYPLQLGGESQETRFTRAWEVKKRDFCLVDEKNRRWWRVAGRKKGGDMILGWVCEKGHEKVSLVSPWDWPGFEVMEPRKCALKEYFQ